MTRTARRHSKVLALPGSAFSEMVAGFKDVKGKEGACLKNTNGRSLKSRKTVNTKTKKTKLRLPKTKADEANPEDQHDPKVRRKKSKLCRFCRQPGHLMQDCSTWTDKSKLCYKCGSSEHSVRDCKHSSHEFPFAKCFVCGEVGHLSKSCSQNPRGLYPEGGGCWHCGSVEHFRTNCPQYVKEVHKTTSDIQITQLSDNQSADSENFQPEKKVTQKTTWTSKHKVIKF